MRQEAEEGRMSIRGAGRDHTSGSTAHMPQSPGAQTAPFGLVRLFRTYVKGTPCLSLQGQQEKLSGRFGIHSAIKEEKPRTWREARKKEA